MFLNSNFEIKIVHSTFNCYNIEDIVNKNKTFLPFTISTHSTPKHHGHNAIVDHVTSLVVNNLTRLASVQEKISQIPTVLTKRTEFTSDTKYAFWILAAIQLPAAFILFFAKKFRSIESLLESEETRGPNEQDNLIKEGSDFKFFSIDYIRSFFKNMPYVELTLLISFLVFLFEGLQVKLNIMLNII